jgi:hypothetical protein
LPAKWLGQGFAVEAHPAIAEWSSLPGRPWLKEQAAATPQRSAAERFCRSLALCPTFAALRSIDFRGPLSNYFPRGKPSLAEDLAALQFGGAGSLPVMHLQSNAHNLADILAQFSGP